MSASGKIGNKGGGRKGYNHQIVIEQAYEIVRKGLKGELETIDEKKQFYAALELVKKALPTNVNLGGDLKVMFNEVFNTASKTKGDSKE